MRDGHACQVCGAESRPNAHHIFSRSNYSVRWDLANGITLCPAHHTLSSKFSAHKTPEEFHYFLVGYLGEAELADLRLKAKSVAKLDQRFKADLKDSLENFIKNH